MTTPDTSAVRAWARENGYEVAGRGRLPAEITDAYAAAHGPGGKPGASRAVKAPARAARKAPAKRPAAPAQVAAPAATAPPAPADTPPAGPGPKPSRVTDDRRLVALGEQLAALTERVERLEKAAGGKDKDKPSRFRRRS